MTDEEAQAIKARWNWNLVDALPTGSQAKADVRALLSERATLIEERAALLAEVDQWRAIGHTLDLIGRDATGALVTDSLYITDCPLCHKRITGPVDDEPRWPSLPKLGHRDDCPVVKARAVLEGTQP